MEHAWPTLPCKQTLVSFSSECGCLQWEEHCEELLLDPDLFPGMNFDEDDEEEEEEIDIPLTPY